MAAPTTKEEAGGAKILPLIDSTAVTSITRLPVSIVNANPTVGGDFANFPPGWMGVGSHRDGDTLVTPGGFTIPAGQTPILVAGGADSASATEGARVARPIRVHEGGAQYFLPGGSYAAAATYQAPLKATNGGVAIAANTANQALSVAVAGNFAYITDLILTLAQATAAPALIPANTDIQLLDASGGTIMWRQTWGSLLTPAAAYPMLVPTVIQIHFSNPPRTSVVNGQFFITTVTAGPQWFVTCNGYYSAGI